jgi:hypothetical protein
MCELFLAIVATISSSAASIGSSETSIDGGVDLAKLSSCKGVREHNREKQLAHTSIGGIGLDNERGEARCGIEAKARQVS